jgi:hypothetical protein
LESLETKINETRAKLTQFMNGTGAYANVPEYIFYKKVAYTKTKRHSKTFRISISTPQQELPKQTFSTARTKVLQRLPDIQK